MCLNLYNICKINLKLALFCLVATRVFSESPNLNSYISSNLKILNKLVEKKKKFSSPVMLSEIFSEYAEQTDKLLHELNETDNFTNECKKQEIINEIAKHMEILEKILNIINHNKPIEELSRFCKSGENFHDAICNRPVKKIPRKHEENGITNRKKAFTQDDESIMG